jgi:hypothetical protein
MSKTFTIAFIYCLTFIKVSNAQTNQYSGWLTWAHQQKLTNKLSFSFDAQLRSASSFDGLQTVLFRPGITYLIQKNITSTIGYGFVGTKVYDVTLPKDFLIEHMVWEQLIYNYKLHNLNMASRIRLEQRFIEQQKTSVFSERLRIFTKMTTPLSTSRLMSKGIYFALQEELLFNLNNKEQLNNHFFDQNRAFIGLGHQFNSNISLEGGYQNIYTLNKNNQVDKHILQFSLFTKL